ncbi:MAG: CC0125/CC1285 family lipoprotein [Phenylobacterium sp.]|uniref:CC0125/CC1285 family lipoprotein n=1 Tax=Phenylobacterium sp. TaxID=1871053 RepID=UPI00391AE07E
MRRPERLRISGRVMAGALSALALSACASSPTFYGPAATPGAVGWSEYQIEQGRFRVTFQGGPGAPVEMVSDYALLRAAELTLSQGYDWFRIADRATTQSGAGRGPRVSLGAGSGSYGGRGGVSLGVGTSFDLAGGGPALSQTLEIVMGRGTPPREPDVYGAREVQRNLGGRAGLRT